jgi:hypothetical protein
VAEDRAALEYSEGLARLTRTLIETVNRAGIVTTRADVTYDPPWQSGRAIPNIIQLEIAPAGALVVRADFSQAQVEDCWRRVDRDVVLAKVRAVAGEYEKTNAAS